MILKFLLLSMILFNSLFAIDAKEIIQKIQQRDRSYNYNSKIKLTFIDIDKNKHIKNINLSLKNNIDKSATLYIENVATIKKLDFSKNFFYSDNFFPNIDDYNYEIMREAKINNYKVWQILVKPKKLEPKKFSQSVIFVRQDNFIIIQVENYTKKDKSSKYIKIKGLKKINNIWQISKIILMQKLKNKQISDKITIQISHTKR